MSKYYTPHAFEFHLGFIYEFSRNRDEEWHEVTYNPEKTRHLGPRGKHVDKEELRVRYLEESDIENLGFDKITEVKKGKYALVMYKKSLEKKNQNVLLNFYPELMKVEVKIVDNPVSDEVKPFRKERVVFTGLVKNASKLKLELFNNGCFER